MSRKRLTHFLLAAPISGVMFQLFNKEMIAASGSLGDEVIFKQEEMVRELVAKENNKNKPFYRKFSKSKY